MSRGLGKNQLMILEALQKKANSCPQNKLMSPEPYMDCKEISGVTGLSYGKIWYSLTGLLVRRKIKLYMDAHRYHRLFGVPELPRMEVTTAMSQAIMLAK